MEPNDYEAVPPIELPTAVNVALAFVPSAVMAAMHTTMINASMTAYSTAVGPSSAFRKFFTQRPNAFMIFPFGSLAIRHRGAALGWRALRRTHGFAPPPCGGLAVTRKHVSGQRTGPSSSQALTAAGESQRTGNLTTGPRRALRRAELTTVKTSAHKADLTRDGADRGSARTGQTRAWNCFPSFPEPRRRTLRFATPPGDIARRAE